MKTALLSFATALTLFVSTAASAATPFDHNDPRRLSPIERARYEKAQRENERRQAQERARYEAAQRKQQAEQQRRQAQERARIEAQRRHDYDHNRR
jgi:membrane protein involved in colicin uptake